MKQLRLPSLRTDGLTLILGLGETGVAAAKWCAAQGATIRVADTRAENGSAQTLVTAYPQQVQLVLGDAALDAAVLEGVHTIVVSPGLSPLQDGVAELLSIAAERQIRVLNEIELFAQALADLKTAQNYQPMVFAVTGTNGKTTVTALVRHMLEFSGLTALAAGNISPAAIQALQSAVEAEQLPDAWVIELSSFQLHYLQALPANAACVLNISQDHLDWHGSLQAYQQAKARIFEQAQVKVVNRDDSSTLTMVADVSTTDVRSFGLSAPALQGDLGIELEHGVQWLAVAESEADGVLAEGARQAAPIKRLMPVDALRIRGQHNVANALAALALCRSVGLEWGPLLHALRDYAGEAHRAEYVRAVRGVTFVNDSKGTNVGATVAALNGLDQPVVLIAGGLGKGQDFQPLVEAVSRANTVAVVLIGASASELHQLLMPTAIPLVMAKDMAEAVHLAFDHAKEGDLVLLSPACASMDMFDSYVHRGNVFVSEVAELALENGEFA